MMVGDACPTYISGQQTKLRELLMYHVFFLTEALRVYWTCVQLAVYFSLQRFEFIESKVVVIEDTMKAGLIR